MSIEGNTHHWPLCFFIYHRTPARRGISVFPPALQRQSSNAATQQRWIILVSVNAKRWRRCKYVTYTVDDTGWLLELEDVDKSTSGEVIAWRVWRRTAAAVAAGTRRRLWDASLPPSWAARVGDEGFQLEPARLRSWAVHVNVEQPVVVTVSVSVINIFTCYSLWYRGRI